MTKILTSPKMISDIVNNGFRYLEEGNYKEAEHLLEFVYSQNKNKSDQILGYALAVAYFNLGKSKKFNNVIKDLYKIPNLNEQIKNTIKEMKRETLREKNGIINISEQEIVEDIDNLKYIQEKIPLTEKEMKTLVSKTEDTFYKFLLFPEINSEKMLIFRKKQRHFLSSIIEFENFENYYYSSKKTISNKKLYSYYYNSSMSKGHTLFLILGTKLRVFEDVLLDPKIDFKFKNEIICDLKIYYDLKYITKRVLNYENKNKIYKFNLVKKSDYLKNIKIIKKELFNSQLSKNYNLLHTIIKYSIKYYKMNFLRSNEIDYNNVLTQILNYLYENNFSISDDIRQYIYKKYINNKIEVTEIKEIALLIEKL